MFGGVELKAWFGVVSNDEAKAAESQFYKHWYMVWTTSDGDEAFDNELMASTESA